MQLQERQLGSSSLLNEYAGLGDYETRDQCAVLSVVFAKDNSGNWRYLLGHCELISETSIAPAEIVYPSFSFVRRKILNFSLSEFLAALISEGFMISENFPPLKKADALSINWMRGLIPSHATKNEFPVVRYTTTLENGLSFQDNPLIAFDLPYVESAREYIKIFLHMDSFHGSSDSRIGEFSIEISDYSARINFNAGTLSFKANVEACIVGRNSSGQPINLSEKDHLNMTILELSESDVFLINKNNEILDYRSKSHWRYRLEGNIDTSISEKLLVLTEAGEGQYLEFKKYIDVTTSRNSKAEDIEKAVCAFSNSFGGKLLLGVSDDGNIDGIDEAVSKQYQCNLSEAVEKYIFDIKKRLSEILKNNQCYGISSIKIGDKTLVYLDVSRSGELNYCVNHDWAFVRVGATSRKMRSAEERPKVSISKF